MNWIEDISNPGLRSWEDFYRNRWQYDKVMRSTHGVNCTGGCSWNIYVKDGIITWEMQAVDYPPLEKHLPRYEPRGCQRGISFSWYLYSPIRVKYPYIRGKLIDLWRKAKEEHGDPVEAWTSLISDEKSRKEFQVARGKGGFRRASWDDVLELISASLIHTIKKHGPDRIIGFSPIPAMSMLSYAAGSRFLQLLGGVNLSFYDWYCDLPNASPEIWGEQTDVQESADWYNSKFIVSMGSNLNMTRTPDVHFVAEARHNGSKFVVFSPDFSQVAKYSDWWIPINAGQDGAFWQAVDHVILKEFYVDRQVEYFTKYITQYTDSAHLVVIKDSGGSLRPDRLMRANAVDKYKDAENGEWKFLIFDEKTKSPLMPLGSVGHRWGGEKGKWNLKMKEAVTGEDIEPVLSFIDDSDEVLQVGFDHFDSGKSVNRGVPVKYIETTDGKKVAVATIFDLMMAQFGVSRGLEGDYPKNYDDENATYTPAWQEKFTGIDRNTVIRFARQFASNGEKTNGKNTVIIGAGINHWYHNNLNYRSAIVGLMLTGSIGVNGGGLAHYVGQEKLAPVASWTTIAMALDWCRPPRLQNAPSFHYVHTDQWRYEKNFTEYQPVPEGNGFASGHTMDMQVKAVKMGWLPFFPQFNVSSLELADQAQKSGAKEDKEIIDYVVKQLKDKKIKYSVEDPDAEECWPRVWFIWRGNALMSSAKGHEYFLRHYLGTHNNAIADEVVGDLVTEANVPKEAPTGKMDLVIDLNFRVDTSALYSDIILPAASWYEKNDLNSTDLHTYIHPLQEVVPPIWESKSDWNIFRAIAKSFSELAEKHLPEPVKDVMSGPLLHDSPAEIAQPTIKDWSKGECEAIPGKTMPNLAIVERDYKNLYNKFISFGPMARKMGLSAHGISYKIEDLYDELVETSPTEQWNGQKYPSMKDVVDAANILLFLAPETNGEVAHRAFENLEVKTGLELTDLAKDTRAVRMDFQEIVTQPRRLLNSPVWSGITSDGRAYSPFCMSIEKLVPWRTLTGRQHFYLDHEGYIAFGEHLPTYKPRPDYAAYGDVVKSEVGKDDKTIMLNYLTPHGKWHIHSTYYDNHRMLTLSRGIEPFWMNDVDAESIGVKDNDWVEVHNDNGVVCTRAVVSARIPRGISIFYHSPERTISVPKSPIRGNRRAGGHNSLTRIRLKPLLMMGGYAQFTYGFNYWGPVGVNRDTSVLVKKLEKLIW